MDDRQPNHAAPANDAASTGDFGMPPEQSVAVASGLGAVPAHPVASHPADAHPEPDPVGVPETSDADETSGDEQEPDDDIEVADLP